METRHTHQVEISTRTMIRAVSVAFAVWLSRALWPVLLVVVVALILVGTLNPLVEKLEARKVKRGLAIGMVFIGAIAVLAVLAAFTVPPLVEQVGKAIEDAPALQQRAGDFLASNRVMRPLADEVRHLQTAKLMNALTHSAIAHSGRALELLTYSVATAFLALYVMIDKDRVRGALFAVFPREYHVRLARVLLHSETIVGGYVRGQAITSAGMAVFTFVLLTLCRVPNAVSLSVFAGLADVLPYIGVLLSIAPAVLFALTRGATTALIVLVALAIYQEVESRVIIPRIYGRVLRLPSWVIVVAILAGGQLGGILGALLALPIAAGMKMLVAELRLSLPGDDTDDTRLRERDEKVEQIYAEATAGAPPSVAGAVATVIADETRKQDSPSDPREAAAVPITSGKK